MTAFLQTFVVSFSVLIVITLGMTVLLGVVTFLEQRGWRRASSTTTAIE